MLRIDCHCDTALWLLKQPSLMELSQAQQDLRRICRYLDVCFMGIFVNEAEHPQNMPQFFQHVLQLLNADIAKHHNMVVPLLYREQLEYPLEQKLLLIGAEGAAGLGENCEFLEQYYQAGLRLIGPAWNNANRYAGGCASDQGLSAEGKRLVSLCNERGILLDGAHLNRRSFWQMLELSQQPIIVSHTCCAALQPHRRNLNDSQLIALAKRGGVAGITFVPDFLGGEGDLPRLCEHIEHAVSLIGSEHVALGSDFDGCDPVPELCDLTKLPLLYQTLIERGMSEKDLKNLAGASVQKLLQKVLPASFSE